MLILEPRYLFDASLAHTTDHVLKHAPAEHMSAADSHSPSSPGDYTPSQPTYSPVTPASVSVTNGPSEILFVDPRVADWQSLIAGVPSNIQVVVLDPSKDGLEQVTAALDGKSDIKALQFLTYGSSGRLELGSSMVTDATLALNATEIAAWGDHLAPNADILLWGCDVGQGSAGATFLSDLHTLTGAQVAASTDATGAAAQGGDWTLEATTGPIDVATPFTKTAMDSYQGVLDSPLPVVAVVSTPTDALLGNSFTETVSFQNGATNAPGYGPFIDLFVPHDAAQSATLTSATYLGSPVTVLSVTLSTTVAGHTGTLGALHPLAVNSADQPLFIQAPAGYQAGDTLYVLQLPFGSYTPGEPAANVVLNFSLNPTTELSSAHASQPLDITAVGGFQFGSDPLSDPATDPSIRGTGASASLSDAADGAVTASTQVDLIDVQATTNLHENETATGPDYPFDYVVTLTPASVTAADPISNFALTFELPGKVQFVSGGTIDIGGASGSAIFTPASTAQGGTVTVDFASLSGGPVTISIPVFVPRTDSTGAAILNPVTGAPVTVTLTPIYSYSGSWNPVSGSLDHVSSGPAPTFSGDSTTDPVSTDFVAKSLAIQVTNDAGGTIVPGQIVTETVHFQVSDYFDLKNLAIQDQLSDGMTLLAPGDAGYVAPTLSLTEGGSTQPSASFDAGGATTPTLATVNGQTVAAAGGSSYWNFSRDDSGSTANPGGTTVNFLVGALLANASPGALASVLEGSGGSGATEGTITFKTRVLDKYTNANGGQSLRESDTVSNTITTSGTSAAVVTIAGQTATATGGVVTDGSSDSAALADNALALSIADINGVAATGSTIKPGDTVTYALTYTLTTGDYGNLQLSSYLPLPVFDASHPNADSTLVSSFTASGSSVPATGEYRLAGPTGSVVNSATVNATSNAITFDLGTRDDTTNTPGQQIVIYFTVKATNTPFADQLLLTNQAQSSDTNAEASVLSQAAINQVTLAEPELTTKTGIVSVVGDNGTTVKGSYSADTSNPSVRINPGAVDLLPSGGAGDPFAKAGTTGSPLTGSGTPLDAADLNVTGADASDTVRIVTTVDNVGHDTAYDVTLNGALPTGYTVASIQNFAIHDAAGDVVSFTKPDGSAATAADYFSSGGIMTTGASGAVAGGGVLYVSYDLKLSATQAAGQNLSASGTTINWANVSGGVAGGLGFVTSGTPTGETAQALSDAATITTSSPSIAKSIVAADDNAAAGSTAPVEIPSVVLGETVQYKLVVTLPEGTLTNGASDVTVADLLSSGTTFVSVDSITYGSGVSHTGGGTFTHSGSQLNFDLGSVVQNANTDAPGTITILYTAVVPSTRTPHVGLTYTNYATLDYSGNTISSAFQTVTELDPLVNETISVDAGAGAQVYSNETLTYTVTLTNGGNAPADNVLDYIKLPAGLTYLGGSLNYVSGGTGESVDDSAATTTGLKVALGSLAAGGTATFTFQATVNPNLAANTSLTVDTPNGSGSASSLPTAVGVGHIYDNTASVAVTTANFTPALSIVGESNDTNGTGTSFAPISAANVTVGDIVRLHAYIQIPEGANPTSLDFALPSGLVYAGGATAAFVSPDGDLTSSDTALSGVTQYQDGSAASAHYVNPSTSGSVANDAATFAPADVLPGSAIDATSTPGHVVVNLGTLSNNDSSATPNYVLVEFNAIVANTAPNQNGVTLASSVSVNGQTSSSVTATVLEPDLTLTKTVSAISAGTVTYSETVTNTGDTTAYGVTLDDPESSNVGPIAAVGSSGSATGLTVTSGNGTADLHATMTLSAGSSETFVYSVTVADPKSPVPDSTATVTYQSLSSASETLSGTTTGASGSTTGTRDSSSFPSGPDDYEATATLGLGTVGGQVWNDLGPDHSTFGESGSHDTALSGVTITGSFAGTGGTVAETVTTAPDGTYVLLVPEGSVSIHSSTPGTGGLAADETLVYDKNGVVPSASPTVSVAVASASAQTGVDFSYQTPNTAPTIANWGTTTPVAYTGGGSAAVLSNTGATTASDAELALLGNNYGGTVLTVERYNNAGTAAAPDAGDSFVGSGTLSLAGGAVTLGSTPLGSYTETDGVLTIHFSTGTTSAEIGQVLNNLAYSNNATNSLTSAIEIGATLNDGNTGGIQGTGGALTSAVALVTLDLLPAPAIDTFTEPNDAPPSGAAVVVDSALSLGPPVGAAYTQATLTITGNLSASEDALSLVANTTTMGNIAASYNAATGALTLTSAGNTATAAQWTAALDAVTYQNNSDTPHTADRTVSLTLTDSASVTTTAPIATVHVVAVNDSPVLNTGVSVTLTNATEDSGVPTGAVGTLISSLVGSGGTSPNNLTDPDGAGAHDGGGIAAPGVAITGANTALGNWYYSTDGGTTWTEFAGSGIATPISDANALHLSSTARVFFQPTVANYNGAIANALTFRAWDQFDGAANGSLSSLTSAGFGTLGTGINTAGSAYSSAVDVLPLVVTPVNDAPIASGSATLAGTAEDTANPPGDTVAHLFGGSFSDTADQQQSASNPTGSVANTLAGVAITADAATPAQGAWQYSTDGGTTWVAVPTSVSETSALILPQSAELRFVPTGNYNGTPGGLTARLIDSSTDVPVAAGVTGLALSTGSTAYSGVDVSGGNDGGITAVSAAEVPLGTVVTPVNDAPIATGSATLAGTAEDTANPPGDTVAHLFGGSFSDTADQQQSASNPTGSVANTLAGVAITADAATPAQGAWQYSTDGGTTWVAVPTSVSETSALILPQSAELRFVPTGNYNGTPGGLTARLIDSSTDVPVTAGVTGLALSTGSTAYSGVDVSGGNDGGITAVSAAEVPLGTVVTPVNDAPIATGSATLAGTAEDTVNPPGDTVAHLFGGSFSDTADQQQSATNPTGSVANTLAGVAITADAATPAQGAWQYSTDGGTTWVAVPTSVSETSALILPQSAELRFVPTGNYNGTPGGLTARLIDSSTDVPVTAGVTGLALSTGSTAYSGVDVSGGNDGGITAVSAAEVPLGTVVTPVNDAPIATGSATLAGTAEDTVNPPGDTVAHLFGGSFSDTADQQQSATNPTGSVANTLAGVAITADAATPAQGAWQYSTDGGTTWVAVPTSVSETSALILPQSAELRFVPTGNYNGTPGGLTARLIDSSTDVPVTAGVTGLALSTGSTAYSGVDVSGGNDGGITAVSAAEVPLGTVVTPVNDAPIATGSATLAGTAEDTVNPPGDTVAHLFGGSFSDTADQQQSAANPTGSVANTLAGVAITADAATPAQGAWQYSTDGGTTWVAVPTSVSETSALILPQSAELRFVPTGNYNGTPGGLTARLIDSSTDVPVTAGVTGLALSTGSTAYSGVDVSGGNDGGITAVSAAEVPLGTVVTPVNDAPIATGSATLAGTAEDTVNPPGDTVAHLFGGSFSDTADQQQSATNPTGSVANTLAGVAITADAATPAQGAWQYSTDGGTTWVAVPTSISETSALILPQSAELRFVPTGNYNGTPGGLTARLIDSSTDVPVTAGVTGLALSTGSTAYSGVDVSGGNDGGITAVSAAEVPLGTVVTPVNDAPIATGAATLAGTAEDTANPPGDTVAHLFGGSFSDTADQQQSATNPTGSVANTLAGVAITADAATPAQGAWQYSTDGGTTWVAVPTSVSETSALILPQSAELRFVPTGNYNGTPGGLTARLIDSSTDVPVTAGVTGLALSTGSTAYSGVDVSGGNDGGITAVSAAEVPLGTQVSAKTNPLSIPTAPPILPVDPLIGFGGPGSPLDGFGNLSDSQLQYDGRPEIPELWLVGSMGNRFIIAEQRATIVAPPDLFTESDSSQHLSYEASLQDGRPLPNWLTFNARNLTFTGTPPEAAHGSLEVRIIARDTAGNEAIAPFRILIGRNEDDKILAMLNAHNHAETTASAAGVVVPKTGQAGHPATPRHTKPPSPAKPATLIRPVKEPNSSHADASAVLHAAPALPGASGAAGRAGFSDQLREAGRMGRLAQARALLQSLG